jgi:hypothetical protein
MLLGCRWHLRHTRHRLQQSADVLAEKTGQLVIRHLSRANNLFESFEPQRLKPRGIWSELGRRQWSRHASPPSLF